jgi:hypothetical protein
MVVRLTSGQVPINVSASSNAPFEEVKLCVASAVRAASF